VNVSKDFDSLVIAGDIGGTNTNLALVGRKTDNFELLLKRTFQTQTLPDLIEPVEIILKDINEKLPDMKPQTCCISAAGPIIENRCYLTNAELVLDGKEIERVTKLPTLIINDFTALSYALPLLDREDPAMITKIPHTDGTFPEPDGPVKIVTGAGTGFGMGLLIESEDRATAYPSEAGHLDFSAFDRETEELKDFVAKKMGFNPYVELFLSGRGIVNIYNFFTSTGKISRDFIPLEVLSAPDNEKPALIAKNASQDQGCARIIKTFVKIYGRYTGNLAILTLPYGGLYLAGGIAIKNEKFFIEDNLFMKYFEIGSKPEIHKLLKKVPVYLIRNYSASIYGAANAASFLLKNIE